MNAIYALLANDIVVGIGVSLLHFLWQGALVGAAFWVALRILRGAKPRARYAAGILALTAMALSPVLTYAWLTVEADSSTALASGGEVGAVLSSVTTESRPIARTPRPQGGIEAARQEQVYHSFGPGPVAALVDLAPWFALLWAGGVMCLSARLSGGLLYVQILRHKRVTQLSPHWTQYTASMAARLGIKRAVAVVESGLVRVPALVGYLKPVILLPGSALTGLEPDQLEALIAHELAHVARHDYMVSLWQTAVETLLFFHPAVWWVSHRVRFERELCCDDMVVELLDNRLAYVRALAAMESLRSPIPHPAAAADGGSLVGRIRRLLGVQSNNGNGTVRGVAGTLAIIVMALLVAWACLSGLTSRAEAASDVARVVFFPEDQSLGQLFVRNAGEPLDISPSGSGENEGWTTHGDARGDIEVPAGKVLKLRVVPHAMADLTAMATLMPDDLEKIDLSGCPITDEMLQPLAGLTSLRALNLNDTSVTDVGLSHLGQLTELEWLGLEGTKVTGTDAPALEALTNLEYLDVYGSLFNDDGLQRLRNMQSLKWLGLEKTMVTGEGLGWLSGLQSLEGLTLERMDIGDWGLFALEDVQSLTYLNLQNTDITDAGLQFVGGLAGLKSLNLRGTGITDEGLRHLVRLTSLESLNLNSTRITDEGLVYIWHLPRLNHVDCAKTRVTPERLSALRQMIASRGVESTVSVGRAQRSTNPEAPKVGVLMSHFTATGPHWIANPYGYQHQFSREMSAFLAEHNFDVYALVEPGTESLGELPALLADAGLNGKTIDCTNVEALKQLDVVITSNACNVLDEFTDALHQAVKAGVGIVCKGNYGTVSGDKEKIAEFMGISRDWVFSFNPGVVECRVLDEHETLLGLKKGDTFQFEIGSGVVFPGGIENGVPLVAAPDRIVMRMRRTPDLPVMKTPGQPAATESLVTLPTASPAPTQPGAAEEQAQPDISPSVPVAFDGENPQDVFAPFYPMYVRNVGQGRLVRCYWFKPGQSFGPFAEYEVLVRSVNWAAKRDPGARW